MGMVSFTVGFSLGFGSGIAFRALAERDYLPIQDMLKTSVGLAQRVTDVTMDTVGRLYESIEDLSARLRAQRARMSHEQVRKTLPRKNGRKKASPPPKKRRPAATRPATLHA